MNISQINFTRNLTRLLFFCLTLGFVPSLIGGDFVQESVTQLLSEEQLLLTESQAEEIISNFDENNWFIHHSLSELSAEDINFLKKYLYKKQLQLWGELGTPSMITCKKWCKPLMQYLALASTLAGISATAYLLGSTKVQENQKSLSCAIKHPVLAQVLAATSAGAALVYLLSSHALTKFDAQLKKLKSVELLIDALE